jgi:hypothetical protein
MAQQTCAIGRVSDSYRQERPSSTLIQRRQESHALTLINGGANVVVGSAVGTGQSRRVEGFEQTRTGSRIEDPNRLIVLPQLGKPRL